MVSEKIKSVYYKTEALCFIRLYFVELYFIKLYFSFNISEKKQQDLYLIGPFRVAGHALSFIFGFTRNNSGASANIEMFKVTATD